MAGSYNTTGYRNADGIPVVQGQTAVPQITTISPGVTSDDYSGIITTDLSTDNYLVLSCNSGNAADTIALQNYELRRSFP